MARLIRIDSELVRRGLARSRTHAAQLVTDGHVTVDGERVSGGLFDFALFFFHNAREQVARAATPGRGLLRIRHPAHSFST